jgi:BlaI family transcriptional regulator, penicillinase repressor
VIDVRLTKLEVAVMNALWDLGPSPIRDIHRALPGKRQPAYTTVQTIVYRLEAKNAVRRVSKIGGAHIFEALVSRQAAEGTLIDELVSLFGGRSQPVVAHLIDTGQLTAEDLDAARKRLAELSRRKKKGERS